jgi:transcriptional regulator with XRE-family HTH domain
MEVLVMVVLSNEEIGARLRRMRVEAGMSMPALGSAIGVTFQSIAKYEKGTSTLTVPQLLRIRDALGCYVTDLIPDGRRRKPRKRKQKLGRPIGS